MATQRCLYQLRNRNLNTTVSRTFHHSQLYNQKEEENSDKPPKKQMSFSERFRKELDPEAQKQLEQVTKNIDDMKNQFKSKLPSLPENFKKSEPQVDPNEPPKPSAVEAFNEKVGSFKERFSQENLTKVRTQLEESMKLKAVSIQEKVEEMKKKQEEEKAKKLEEKDLEKESPVEKVSFVKRMDTFAQEKGFDNNPMYQKVKDATSDTSTYVRVRSF